MMLNKYVAIDLGSSKITALAAEVQADNTLKILAVESKPAEDVKHGIIEQLSGAAYKISELTRLIQNSARIHDIDQVSVSVGAKSMKSTSVTISRFVGASKTVSDQLIYEMNEECIKKVQKDNIAVFDVIPLYYELDGHRTDDPTNKRATQITAKYTVIYGNKAIKDAIDRCFERTGLIAECIPVTAECLSTAVLDENDRENGCALINFGASTTTLAIYKNDTLQQMLIVPLGGKNITKDIQELGISESHAERLKCIKGFAMERLVEDPIFVQIPSLEDEKPPVKISTKFLATIIEARIEEILQPIIEKINAFPDTLEEGIIITGGASQLKNLIDLVSEKTGMETRLGSHAEWLTDKSAEKYINTELSQLVGTILLQHEYRQEHPVEEIKVVKTVSKLPKKGLKDRIANGLINFFGDENSMNEDKEDDQAQATNKKRF